MLYVRRRIDMTTVANLITEIRANLNEDSTVVETFYSNSELIAYIKRSINDICIDTDSNYYIYQLDITGSTVGTATSLNASSTINITYADHGLVTRDTVYLSGVTSGTISALINDNYYEVTRVDDDNFTLAVDGEAYTWGAGPVITKMPTDYAFTSISASSTIPLVDLRFMAYRAADWDEWLYDDLPKTTPKAGVSFSTPSQRRQSCTVYNDTIYLAKGPEIDDKILVAGRWLKTPITTSGDTYPLGAIEEDASIKYATSMGWLKKNKIETGRAWQALYQERKTDIQQKTAKKIAITFPSTLTTIKNNDSLLNFVFRLNQEITS